MLFEYDPTKSAANAVKHGIDFVEAQALWTDAGLVTLRGRVQDEVRWVAIGKIGNAHWAAVYARRDDRLRLISVRRARRKEVAIYERG